MAFFLNDDEVFKAKQLINKAQPFYSYDQTFDVIHKWGNGKYVISFLNMYAIQIAITNDEFFNALMNSDLLLFDGIGVRVLCKMVSAAYGKNMNGTDYIPVLIDKFSQKEYIVFASKKETIDIFINEHPGLKINYYLDGFHNYTAYCSSVNDYNADIVLLGMGMPKQEILSSKLTGNFLVINGGAIVDYLSGYKRRAPKIFIKLHLEWLFRIFYEPRRLFARYAEGFNVIFRLSFSFLIKYFQQLKTQKTFDEDTIH